MNVSSLLTCHSSSSFSARDVYHALVVVLLGTDAQVSLTFSITTVLVLFLMKRIVYCLQDGHQRGGPVLVLRDRRRRHHRSGECSTSMEERSRNFLVVVVDVQPARRDERRPLLPPFLLLPGTIPLRFFFL